MGNVLQRALFAWRFRDVNLLISGQIEREQPDHALPRHPDAGDEGRAVPHVRLRPVPRDRRTGSPSWIWDAYTTTNEYPYSESVNLAEATDGSLPSSTGDVNYMRNSVKVVVDAYIGTLTYYADDGPDGDPIVHAWANAFPELFTSIDEAPQEPARALPLPRGPVPGPGHAVRELPRDRSAVFYQKQDFWQIPDDPTLAQEASDGGRPTSTDLRPYYLLMKVPARPRSDFQLVLPFVPQGRPNMVAWIAADSDPENYGQMVAFTFPSGANVDGPAQVFSRINQNPQFSRERTLLDQGGSHGAVRRLPGDPRGRLVPVRAARVRAVGADARRCPSSSGSSS